jgi:hypothetical protein
LAKCARLGIQDCPPEYGGASVDILTTMLTMEGWVMDAAITG